MYCKWLRWNQWKRKFLYLVLTVALLKNLYFLNNSFILFGVNFSEQVEKNFF